MNFMAAKYRLTLLIMKTFVDFATAVRCLTVRKPFPPNDPSHIPLYLITNSNHFYLGLHSLFSLFYFYRRFQIKIIYTNKISFIHKIILKKLHLWENTFDTNKQSKLNHELDHYPWAKKLYKTGWQGKKFFIPLLEKKRGVCVILDSDTICIDKPTELINSIEHKNHASAKYLLDCGNYSLLSNIEFEKICQAPLKKNRVNTGLVFINLNHFWEKNSMDTIDRWIKNLTDTLSQRLVSPRHHSEKNWELSEHLFEQTLFSMTLNNLKTEYFNKHDYYVFSRHIYNQESVNKPVFIHFSGEENKKSMYRYLFFSLIKEIKNLPKVKASPSKPWYSNEMYCINCWHMKKNANY